MKLFLPILLTVLYSYANGASTINPGKEMTCLELEGKILNINARENNCCIVELICNNEIITVRKLKNGVRKFKFYLLPDQTYTVRISSEGYISRLITINTNLRKKRQRMYRFQFRTRLVKEREKQIRVNNIQPFAHIFYDQKRGYFYYKKMDLLAERPA